MTIDKKKIKDEVKNSLNAGKTKEEIYDEISAKYKDFRVHKDIANIIRFVPEKVKLKKYRIYNLLFLILLIIIDLANAVTLNYWGLIWFGVLTYLVATNQTKHYYWISIFGGIIMISGLALTLYGYFGNGLNPFTLIVGSAVLGAIFILFGIYMPKFLTPDYTFSDEIVTDTDGERRKKRTITYN